MSYNIVTFKYKTEKCHIFTCCGVDFFYPSKGILNMETIKEDNENIVLHIDFVNGWFEKLFNDKVFSETGGRFYNEFLQYLLNNKRIEKC